MKFLNRFQNNAEMRDAVKAFLIEQVKTQATTKLFNAEPVDGYREAIAVIQEAFAVLDRDYAKPE
jgi:hypothetical protein